MPANAVKLRQMIQASQVILVASPNYNGSYSGTFKNVMDWASRTEQKTYDKSILTGKKIALMSASPSQSGGAKALEPARALFETLRANVASRQVSIPCAHEAFDSAGHLKDRTKRKELENLVHEVLSN
jgi:NAD(P)H-dependent FMN reductase